VASGASISFIMPKPLNTRRMAAPITAALKSMGRILQKDLEGTVRTWKKKPRFAIYTTPFSFGTTKVSVEFSAPGDVGQIWRWTDWGTRPHIIKPKPTNKLGVLIFGSKFRSKTTPRLLKARAGMKGGPPVIARKVHHPGTEPRKFSQRIAQSRKLTFELLMQKALNEAAKASGQYYRG